MKTIDCFDGRYAFLSNFFETKLYYNGEVYLHAEGAFQAAKSLDPQLRKEFALMLKSPGQAKRAGRGKPFKSSTGETLKLQLRPDWEEVKDSVMYDIVYAKFSQNTELKQALLLTGDAILIEGNYWHDNYWGNCSCERCANRQGRNQLGKILMQVRARLRYEDENPSLIYNKQQLLDLFIKEVDMLEQKLVLVEETPNINQSMLLTRQPLPKGALDGPLKPPCSK